MNALQRIFLAIFIFFPVFIIAGCGPSQKEIDVGREVIQDELMSQFFVGAIICVFTVFFGPSILDGVRKLLARNFNWSTQSQKLLAVSLYSIAIASTLTFSLMNQYMQKPLLSVILLLGVTCYPFFVHVLPSIETEDKPRMKIAIGQIKTLFILIVIAYVIMRITSPGGIGGIVKN